MWDQALRISSFHLITSLKSLSPNTALVEVVGAGTWMQAFMGDVTQPNPL